jgi:hypothetical protein
VEADGFSHWQAEFTTTRAVPNEQVASRLENGTSLGVNADTRQLHCWLTETVKAESGIGIESAG